MSRTSRIVVAHLIVALLVAVPGAAGQEQLFVLEPDPDPPGPPVASVLAPALQRAVRLKSDFVGLTRRGRGVYRSTIHTPRDVEGLARDILGPDTMIMKTEEADLPVEDLIVVLREPDVAARFADFEVKERYRSPRGSFHIITPTAAPDPGVAPAQRGIPWAALSSLDAASGREARSTPIALAEADYPLDPQPVETSTPTVPDDPYYVPDTQWGLQTIGADLAWRRGDGHVESDVLIAVIDTGIDYDHPDLADNMWSDPGAALDGDDLHGASMLDGDVDPLDHHGHGTHVAGIIGGVGNNGIGIAGVCWKSELLAIQVFDDSGKTATISHVIKGIDYALDRGARVINMSFAGVGYSEVFHKRITDAETDALFVTAAGNKGNDNDGATRYYPACYDAKNVIAVLAVNSDHERPTFSNYGKTTVHIGAPGQSIFSTIPGGGYGFRSGSSMAAAFVSGAAALIWSVPAYAGISPAEMRELLIDKSSPYTSLDELCQAKGELRLTFLEFEAP